MSEIRKVGVIGAGTMGNGIAQACAVAGIDVVMVDVAEAAVLRGLATITGSLDRLVKKEKLTAADKDAAIERIHGSTSYDVLGTADLVIEAATENEELKFRILKQADALAKPGRDHRVEHVVDLDHQARRRDVARRPLHRHALLQSGADDGAGRADPRPADRRRDRRRRRGLRQAPGQDADRREEQPRASSSTGSCAR